MVYELAGERAVSEEASPIECRRRHHVLGKTARNFEQVSSLNTVGTWEWPGLVVDG